MKHLKIEKSALSLIPSKFALENKVLPLSLDNNSIKIAMVNISDFTLIKDLMFITRKNVISVQMEEDNILKEIAENYQIQHTINEIIMKDGITSLSEVIQETLI